MDVGVPLMVIVLLFHVAITPPGKFEIVPIPVAPVVLTVILGEIAVFKQSDGFAEGEDAVFAAFTMIAPVALTEPQPPFNGIE